MTEHSVKSQDADYILPTYARFDVALAKGKGCDVWDFNGKHYLDFTSGIGTNSLGFADEQWQQAVAFQASQLQHCSNLFYSAPAAQLAEKLCAKTGMKKVFFANSGAEANEGAIKAARKYSTQKYGANRHVVLTLKNSFHGRTITTLSATGQESFHQHFFPFTEGFRHLPANEITLLRQHLAQYHDVCAIMLEIVQGEGGILPLNADYLAEVQTLCQQHDILLIIDEVQTGIGRTGKCFAYQHFNLQPDIVTSAKGLGGGLPIGAILFNEKCQQILGKGDHGSTFGGNPISCAAANVVLDRLTPDFLAEVTRKGEKLHQALLSLPHVVEVTGLGLMMGVTFAPPIQVADVLKQAIEQGVLFLSAKQKLRLLPPLVITDTQIEQGVAVLKQILTPA